MPAAPAPSYPIANEGFEGFLAEVERDVPDAAQVLLFSGEHLRLEITLLRHERNPRVIWGLKGHEDWAFKATLLRFARGPQPVRLLRSIEKEGTYELQGWSVQRTMDAFSASPLPSEQTRQFWDRCLAPTLESAGQPE